MEESVLDRIVREGKEIEAKQGLIQELKRERLDVSSQIERKREENTVILKDERARTLREIQSRKAEFEEAENALEQQLKTLRADHAKGETDLQDQLDSFIRRTNASADKLKAKQQKIDKNIEESEKWLQDLQRRYMPGADGQTSTQHRPAKVHKAPPITTDTPKRQPTSTGDSSGQMPKPKTTAANLPREPKTIHEDFPIVVYFRGKWREVACFVCLANSPRDTPRGEDPSFFKGWNMLKHHLRLAHGEKIEGLSAEQLFKSCIQRDITQAEDLARLRKGLQPQSGGPIQKRKTLSVWRRNKRAASSDDAERTNGQTHDGGEDSEDDDDKVIIPGRRRRFVATQNDSNAPDTHGNIENSGEEDELAINEGTFAVVNDDDDGDVTGAPGNIIAIGPEQFAKISCKYCGANARSDIQEYFDGAEEMQEHLSTAHTASVPKDLPLNEVLNHCQVEKISLEDLENLDRGDMPNEMKFAPAEQKANIEMPDHAMPNHGVLPQPKTAPPIETNNTNNQQTAAPAAVMTPTAPTSSHVPNSDVPPRSRTVPPIETKNGNQQTAPPAAIMTPTAFTPPPRGARTSLSSIDSSLDPRIAYRQRPPPSKITSTKTPQQASSNPAHQNLGGFGVFRVPQADSNKRPVPAQRPIAPRPPDSGDSPPWKKQRKAT